MYRYVVFSREREGEREREQEEDNEGKYYCFAITRIFSVCVCSNIPGLRKKNITTKLSKILLSSIYSKFSSFYSSYGDNKERKTLFLTNEFFLEELEGKYIVEGGVISSLLFFGEKNRKK